MHAIHATQVGRPSIAKAKKAKNAKDPHQAMPPIIQHAIHSSQEQYSSSQPQRIPSRLRVAPDPLATRHVFLVLLLGLPLVLLFDHILHVLCSFAGWLSDLGSDVAHGGPENCFQAAAYRVADGVEEAFWGVSLLIC
jgi:hypothetical protein